MDRKEERVRTRAYEIWEREGWPDGGAEQHWLRAEEELRAEDAGLGKETDDATKSVREQEIETENDRARKPTGTGTVAVGTVVAPDLAGTSR